MSGLMLVLVGMVIGFAIALLPVRNARERRRISRDAIREHDRITEAFKVLATCLASTTATATAVVSEKNA